MNSTKDKLIFGRNPVIEALEEAKSVNKVFIARNLKGQFERHMRNLTKELGIPLQYVDPVKLKNLTSGQNHQGVVAFMSAIPFYSSGELVNLIFDRGEQPLILVLDGITDVRNFGAIARSAEVLGAHGIIIGMKNAAPVNEVAIKTSAGALLRIPVCRCSSIHKEITELKNYGLQILGADMSAAIKIHESDLKRPTVIVLGSEEFGISKAVKEQLDESFSIPQIGQTESLNVSVASGIILYEVSRQRIS